MNTEKKQQSYETSEAKDPHKAFPWKNISMPHFLRP